MRRRAAVHCAGAVVRALRLMSLPLVSMIGVICLLWVRKDDSFRGHGVLLWFVLRYSSIISRAAATSCMEMLKRSTEDILH